MIMEHKYVVLALMFLAVGGLTSATTPEPSLVQNEVELASSTTPPVEATEATPDVPPTVDEGDLPSATPTEGPVASADNETSATSTEAPSADSPDNALPTPPTEAVSTAADVNEVSVPPTQSPSPVEGQVSTAPIGLVDEEGFPIDAAPTPEIAMPPPPVSPPSPPVNPASTGVPHSGASTLRISSVIIVAGVVGVFSL